MKRLGIMALIAMALMVCLTTGDMHPATTETTSDTGDINGMASEVVFAYVPDVLHSDTEYDLLGC
jgi:hypothetical protein